MHFIYNGLFLLAALKWGDWKNFKAYYSTLLFFALGDLLKNFLFYLYPFWTYQESIFGETILRNHTIISIMIMVIVYPSTILIYLGNYPTEKWKQLLWIAFWVLLYVSVEFVNLDYLNLISHHHGWNIWWSLFFNIVMFVMLRVHYKKPLVAWVLSILWIVLLWSVFRVPVDIMR